MKNMEQMVLSKFGDKLNEVGFALMTGNFMITEVCQNAEYGSVETELTMIVDGVEVTMTLQKRGGGFQ